MLDMKKMPGSFNENEAGKIKEERKGRRMKKRQEGREEERIEDREVLVFSVGRQT